MEAQCLRMTKGSPSRVLFDQAVLAPKHNRMDSAATVRLLMSKARETIENIIMKDFDIRHNIWC